MPASRRPLKALRDFLHHIAKFCFAPKDVRDKRFYQKATVNYCNLRLPNWHVSGDPDEAILFAHEEYWHNMLHENGVKSPNVGVPSAINHGLVQGWESVC